MHTCYFACDVITSTVISQCILVNDLTC